MLIKAQRKVPKTSNLAYGMLLAQGQIYAKNVAFYELIGCVRFAWYCGKMYSRHLFPYGGFFPCFQALRRKPANKTSPVIMDVTMCQLDACLPGTASETPGLSQGMGH